jgi:hypothetical protein
VKARLLLAAPAGEDRAAYRAAVLARHAPALLAVAPALAALSVNLVDATPERLPWQRPGEPAAAEPDYDAVLDLRGEAAALDAATDAAASIPAGARLALRVEERVEKDELPRPTGCVPGVKFLSLMRFHDDLSDAAARRLWAHHAPLALRVHVGMARYLRDWVLSSGAGFHGIAELHFPSTEAMMTRWFDSEEGRAAIVHDVGHFLLRSTRLYTTEHVLRAG